jgi:hypothetical protein
MAFSCVVTISDPVADKSFQETGAISAALHAAAVQIAQLGPAAAGTKNILGQGAKILGSWTYVALATDNTAAAKTWDQTGYSVSGSGSTRPAGWNG